MLVIGPQIIFQILTEFQHHNTTDRKVRFADLFVVDVINNFSIVWQMTVAGLWGPVLVGELFFSDEMIQNKYLTNIAGKIKLRLCNS